MSSVTEHVYVTGICVTCCMKLMLSLCGDRGSENNMRIKAWR